MLSSISTIAIPLRMTFSGSVKFPIMLSQMVVPTAKLHVVLSAMVVSLMKQVVNVEVVLLHMPQSDLT